MALATLPATSQAAPVRFAKAVGYPPGGSWYWTHVMVAVGDVNGDGHPDLVVADSGVSVLLGNGDGTFQSPVSYSTGRNATSVAISDVNGDGKSDVVVADPGGVSVLLGNGDGTFQTAVTYGLDGSYTASVAVGDVNGDGKPDIVVTDYLAGVVAVMLGNGDGTFQTYTTYSSGGAYPASVAIADVNGDGRPDIVVANLIGGVGVLLGNSDGTFRAPVSYSCDVNESASVAIADVNGDGKLDIMVATGLVGTVGVLLGNGDGTFQQAVNYGTGCRPSGGFPAYAVAVADVNGDGRPDLVVGGCGVGRCANVSVLVGNGDGTFQAAVTYGSGVPSTEGEADSIALGDLNGDGKPDIVVGNFVANGVFNVVSVLLNDFTAPSTTRITSALDPSFVNQLVTFTATVASISKVPDGQIVTFYDLAKPLASVRLASGAAAYSTSSLSPGNHSIGARYAGDTWHKSSTGHIRQAVLKYPNTTALSSSANPSTHGQVVTFTAMVTSAGATPTGKVSFQDGTKVIGTAALSGSVAKLTTSNLAVGTHSITAEYLGDADDAKSTSAVLDQVVD
jgi:Bacterial Ig-like domain (group 3)/FG-GAP-like repeat